MCTTKYIFSEEQNMPQIEIYIFIGNFVKINCLKKFTFHNFFHLHIYKGMINTISKNEYRTPSKH